MPNRIRPLFAAALLCFCFAAFAQGNEPTDLDWQTEIDRANSFYDAGDYGGAIAHAQRALDIAHSKHLGPRYVAGADQAMAWALRRQGKFAESERLDREALRLRESVLPPTHFRVLQSVQSLGVTLYMEKRYEDAEPMFTRTIAGLSALTDRDGPTECMLGQALTDLGYIRYSQHRYDQAEGLLTRAINSYDQVGPGCGEMHMVYAHLAWLYDAQGHPERIEPLYKRAVADLEPGPGERPEVHFLYYLAEYGSFLVRQKRYADAEPVLKRAVSLMQDHPFDDRASFETALGAYVTLLQATNRSDEASAMQGRLDSLHHATAETSTDPGARYDAAMALATKAQQEQRWEESEKAYREALAAAASFPAGEVRYAEAYINLANFLLARERPREAMAVLQQGVALVEKAHVANPQGSMLYDNLAGLQQLASANDAAEVALRAGVAYREKWKQPPDAIELTQLASLQRAAGRNDQAIRTARQAIAAGEHQWGPDAIAMAGLWEVLGLAYEAQKNYPEAEKAYLRALAIEEKRFGPDHPALAGMLAHVVTIDRAEGKYAEADQAEARRNALRKR